jgi:hypothetical protein
MAAAQLARHGEAEDPGAHDHKVALAGRRAQRAGDAVPVVVRGHYGEL